MRARIAWIVTLSSLTGPLFAADDTFFHDAAQDGMAEVALGRLAATKASSDSVKTFGRLMVDEHGAAHFKLTAAAAKSGVTLPTELAEDAQLTQKNLASLSGRAFDQAYVESQIKAHTKTMRLVEKEISSGTDPAARAWARDAVPMVKRHAEMVGSLGATPGEHELEHAVGIPGPARAPPDTATPH